MSTRTNIINVDNKKEILNLYRHMDGYPEGTGAELVQMCREAEWNKDRLMALMDTKVSSYTGRKHYQPMGDSLDINEDLDYLYMVNLPNHTIIYYEIPPFQYKPDVRHIANAYTPVQIA